MMTRMKGDMATIQISADDNGIIVRIETLNNPVQERVVKHGQSLTATLKGDMDSVTKVKITPLQKGVNQYLEDCVEGLTKPRSATQPVSKGVTGCAWLILILVAVLIYCILKATL